MHRISARWSRAAKRERAGRQVAIAMTTNTFISATLYILTQSIFSAVVSHYIFDYGLFYGIKMLDKKQFG